MLTIVNLFSSRNINSSAIVKLSNRQSACCGNSREVGAVRVMCCGECRPISLYTRSVKSVSGIFNDRGHNCKPEGLCHPPGGCKLDKQGTVKIAGRLGPRSLKL